jgi:hypothetical protein
MGFTLSFVGVKMLMRLRSEEKVLHDYLPPKWRALNRPPLVFYIAPTLITKSGILAANPSKLVGS